MIVNDPKLQQGIRALRTAAAIAFALLTVSDPVERRHGQVRVARALRSAADLLDDEGRLTDD